MRKIKLLIKSEISQNNISIGSLAPILGQFNIRDNSGDILTLIKSYLFTFLKNSPIQLNFLKTVEFPIKLIFNRWEDEDTKILIYYPSLGFLLKKIILFRNEEFFLPSDLFKLSLLTLSSNFLNFLSPEESELNFNYNKNLYSFSMLYSSTRSLDGIIKSFRSHLLFKSRNINYRRKQSISFE